MSAAEADKRSAEAARNEAYARYGTQQKLFGMQKGAIRGTTVEDLRAAKLSLLHSKSAFRKPFYWAPFQLYTGS